ncbi:hypothetical protein KKA93_02655 [Patescibacteria group bacterium]|nr:hypothetical protein [Patescibacteria group bacterium]MBU1663206.1 hypothetical protein [Patescibacteria group bacterium]MBU1933764.1 hypothetical protein [Patescibacteria group bacterium]MBU2007500.1 hypothetical protein [Patescibacteria group bacterium]MBU2233765.1 hypothetical protein [Patescibacteria group bacterium]
MKKTNDQKLAIITIKILNKVLLFAIIILGVYFIAGTNDLTIKGFALNDLKAQKNRLIQANNKLELNALSSSSYSNIKKRVSNLRMVAAGEVNYLIAGAEAVAKK